MKNKIILLLLLGVCLQLSAQIITRDTVPPDYERDLKTILRYTPPPEPDRPYLYKTAAIIVGTFIINETIIRHDHSAGCTPESISRKTGIVYATGMTAATVMFTFELKKHKRKQIKNCKLRKQNNEQKGITDLH